VSAIFWTVNAFDTPRDERALQAPNWSQPGPTSVASWLATLARALSQSDARRWPAPRLSAEKTLAAIAFSYDYGHLSERDNFLICIKWMWGVHLVSHSRQKSIWNRDETNIMCNRHWLEYDFVSLVVLFAGIGFVALIVLGIWSRARKLDMREAMSCFHKPKQNGALASAPRPAGRTDGPGLAMTHAPVRTRHG
jgi:hypothetical protein